MIYFMTRKKKHVHKNHDPHEFKKEEVEEKKKKKKKTIQTFVSFTVITSAGLVLILPVAENR